MNSSSCSTPLLPHHIRHGGKLHLANIVIFHRSREIEIDGIVSEFLRRSGGRGGEMGSSVTTEGLAGAEDPGADWALVDFSAVFSVAICHMGSDPIGGAAPDLLVAGPVAAQGLVRAEHLFACLALEPGSAFGGDFQQPRLVFLLLLFSFGVLGFEVRCGRISHPNVSREHHEAEGHIFFCCSVGHRTEELGLGFGFRVWDRRDPMTLGAPAMWAMGRLGLALSVLNH